MNQPVSIPAGSEIARQPGRERLARWLGGAEAVAIPLLALVISAGLFSIFLLILGKSPVQFYSLIWLGGFGTPFSWSNTLLRAAPLMLMALAVAIPARLGLTMIGGEGALVLGGFAAAAIAVPLIGTTNPVLMHALMLIAAMAIGAIWIGIAGGLRHHRGVNETISSLLLSYIAIAIMNFFVEGALRDPADPNKPSTKAIGSEAMIGKMPGIDVHWGLAVAVVACILLYVLMQRTTYGFACRIAGGNARAALAQGLPVGKRAISRWPRCMARRMPRLPPAMASRAFSWRFSRGITRWRSFRWRYCSAASRRRAASSSAAWACRMRACCFCRA